MSNDLEIGSTGTGILNQAFKTTRKKFHIHLSLSRLLNKIHKTNWCGVVWCGVVWCGVVWCGVVWCGVVWCGVVYMDEVNVGHICTQLNLRIALHIFMNS